MTGRNATCHRRLCSVPVPAHGRESHHGGTASGGLSRIARSRHSRSTISSTCDSQRTTTEGITVDTAHLTKYVEVLENLCMTLIGQVAAQHTVSTALIEVLDRSQPVASELSQVIEAFAKRHATDLSATAGGTCGKSYEAHIELVQSNLRALRAL